LRHAGSNGVKEAERSEQADRSENTPAGGRQGSLRFERSIG
jgi:hypothetical protein